MNVIVLGASSAIGAGVAEAFSAGNRLLVTGRDTARLRRSADRCRAEGASDVVEVPVDLRHGSGELEKTAQDWQPDLIINAASATSRLRDHQISIEEMGGIVAADLLTPFEVIKAVIANRGNRPVGILFISTMLSVVKSPDREIYGALKRIHEKILLGIAASQPDLRLLIVRISKWIPPDVENMETKKLGLAVLDAYHGGKQVLYYGFPGRLMTALYYAQPLLFGLAVRVNRFARKSIDRVLE
jgi:NADP-dependent 3-hydroxy acid dehydrogenase YdfG